MQTDASRLHHSGFLRRLALAGVRHGPGWFVRVSPRVLGALFAVLLPDERRRVRSALRRVHGPRAP
ncbi:MAG TPA: hypothetical protein VGQ57_00355, partial [Polyangiaceae bacterium]|nr:hypothetical protein [Polyangiaceae bacterium]